MVLKGNKVILRPVRLSDAGRFVKWFNDPEVYQFIMTRGVNLKDERKWVRSHISGKVKNDLFLCIDTKQGIHIGTIGLHKINKQNKHASFGITIGEKEFWNQGLGSEAASLIIDHGFRKLKLHRIDLDVYSNNPRAIKVYKRLGFKKEGVKREHRLSKGKYYDTYCMAILDREWKTRQPKIKP
jgi:RimJ/RimL family protein N-acetyltransferase